MNRPSFESASGLRPAAAFLMIAAVLVMVLVKAWSITHKETHAQPERGSEEHLPRPDFDIADRLGRTLALSVQRMDLCLSPNSMWQAHTPRRIAKKIAPFLGGKLTVDQLLEEMIPDAENGIITVVADDWLLGYEEAARVQAWIESMGIEKGFALQRLAGAPQWRIRWRPEWLLSEEIRPRKPDSDKPVSPLRWSRKLADGLAKARWPETALDTKKVRYDELKLQRRGIWKALMPCGETTALKGLPPENVSDLIGALDGEGVQGHQMQIEYGHERVYPPRDETPGNEAFQILGNWRFLNKMEETAPIAALLRPRATPKKQARLARQLLDVKHPCSGLEGLAGELLADPSWRFIRPEPASYRFRRDWPVHQPARRYFFDDSLEEETPRVYTTIDSELQKYLHQQLEETMAVNTPAVAMGIVVEVATGEVLAVDGISAYEVAEFIPTWHLFTPGSTFKVIVMTTALDQDVVKPLDLFNTHNGNYRIPGSSRTIHEALGAPTDTITATTALSESCNAVMVQIGAKVDDDVFHEKLTGLRYAVPPDTGIGVERKGSIPDLPWKAAWSHASVSFGHEVLVSLWQHAAALATVARGGEYLPLTTLLGVEWEGMYYSLPAPEPDPVFSLEACRQTHRMMEIGATEGTGERLTKADREAGTPIVFASKTGTTEKKTSECCLHLEMKRNQDNARLPLGRRDPGFVTYDQMMRSGEREHRGSCYTSSICLLGRLEGDLREVMVLIVVEEPRGKVKFGSDVAGPAALAVLKEALGLTCFGVEVERIAGFKPDYGHDDEWNDDDHPWAHDARAEEDSW